MNDSDNSQSVVWLEVLADSGCNLKYCLRLKSQSLSDQKMIDFHGFAKPLLSNIFEFSTIPHPHRPPDALLPRLMRGAFLLAGLSHLSPLLREYLNAKVQLKSNIKISCDQM